MKKVIFLILSFILVFSMVGCSSEEETKEPKPVFTFGEVENNSYYNDFLGLGVVLDDSWTFHTSEQIKDANGFKDKTDEEVAKALKSSKLIVDMLAINSDSSNISVMLEKADEMEIDLATADKLLNNLSSGATEALNEAGASNIKENRQTIKIGEREFYCLTVSATVNNTESNEPVNVFTTVAAFKSIGYIGSISVTTYNEDKTMDILSMFHTDKNEDTDTTETTSPESEVVSLESVPSQTEKEREPIDSDIIEHSDLYIPNVNVDDMINYFSEVCLDAEFSESQDVCFVQKWISPITYRISGNYTDEDISVLNSFCDYLNSIEGFPGIQEVSDSSYTTSLTFGANDELVAAVGEVFVGNDGYVTFWFNGLNELYKSEIYCRSDITQEIRNSVILEEMYNGLGPMQDTSLREDSIIYSGFTTPQELSEIDKVILSLLYHPDIKCGMNKDECSEVIRRLYY